MNRLLGFYEGNPPDDRGRFLAEILRQDDRWLEATHDFVQWLFPLREPSRVTHWAPVIDAEVRAAFQRDERLRGRLLASFRRMLAFYGLTHRDGLIVKASNWAERKGNWFTHATHNDLRITRMLKSLDALGLRHEAEALLACLDALRASESDCGIGETAFRHWRGALGEPCGCGSLANPGNRAGPDASPALRPGVTHVPARI
jgi:hypothetical protein